MISDLIRLTPMGGTLPSVRFFEPTPAFVRFMSTSFAGRPIYDVGAGCGHVARALRDVKLEVIALDVNHREDSCFPVMISNGVTHPYASDSVVLLARPCHGLFAEAVARQAIKCGVSDVIYVGFGKNVARDLGPLRTGFKAQRFKAGQANERVFWSHS